ncbi:MAG: flagellar basal body P-ring protein FlgI [Planctomycetota bacterium]|nr:MAG: flagellar basal body P-ring protein FlgI [Planctomycetota bacterium]REK47275.1 MAG: flagellar basal body P-ring protein FlgI [Planctomycetota bacterium]
MFRRLTISLIIASCSAGLLFAPAASAQTPRLKDICRVKGQEDNTLQGLGLVIGLNGTGDSAASVSTIEALATAMRFMGAPVPAGVIKEPKNIALVMIQVTVPPAGARQGDRIDCVVSSIGDASSLADGRLIATPLLGPRTTGEQVFAIAEGQVMTPNPQVATNGKIIRGCRLEEDFRNGFVKDGKITLVLDKNKAGFQVALDVAERINDQTGPDKDVTEEVLARALDQVNIEVTIPEAYRGDEVTFIADIMEKPIFELATEARVVINRDAKTVVVTGDTTIGGVVINHRNLKIETGAEPLGGRFVEVESPQRSGGKLTALVDALEAVQADTDDIADILLGLSRSGKLHARVIIE